jgi:hypothetical protein
MPMQDGRPLMKSLLCTLLARPRAAHPPGAPCRRSTRGSKLSDPPVSTCCPPPGEAGSGLIGPGSGTASPRARVPRSEGAGTQRPWPPSATPTIAQHVRWRQRRCGEGGRRRRRWWEGRWWCELDLPRSKGGGGVCVKSPAAAILAPIRTLVQKQAFYI